MSMARDPVQLRLPVAGRWIVRKTPIRDMRGRLAGDGQAQSAATAVALPTVIESDEALADLESATALLPVDQGLQLG
ncbi:hypothetical protein K0651_05590 [Ornithinimicrobium sp. Arc0846-15]|nr:hypothetical protein [Ornithinimicrobium laminariae]